MKVQYVKRGSIFSKSTTQRCMCSSSAKPTHTHTHTHARKQKRVYNGYTTVQCLHGCQKIWLSSHLTRALLCTCLLCIVNCEKHKK